MYTGIGGCWGLSDQAASVAEEIAMGMAPVGPRRPPDFVRTMLLYPAPPSRGLASAPPR